MQSIRNRIIEHATNLFVKNGCKSLTMDDIAGSMGISKRTIYENFTDKRDLLKQSLIYFFERESEEVTKILESSDDILSTIFNQTHHNSKKLMKIKGNLFYEMQKYYPDLYFETVYARRQEHLGNTKKILRKGQEDGMLRNDINVEIIALLILEINQMIIASTSFEDMDRMDCIRVFMSCFMRGIATGKGIEMFKKYKFIENI